MDNNQSKLKKVVTTPTSTKKGAAPIAAPVLPKTGVFHLFQDSLFSIDRVQNEEKEQAAQKRLRKIVFLEAVVILGLSAFLVLGQPFFEPIYTYYSMNPQKKVTSLVPLIAPNMTNKAITSWSATAVTELMTIGFGDFESRILSNRKRFTPDGWNVFVRSFLNAKVGEVFKKNNLVLTTIPREMPEIVWQGENARMVYEWKVKVPVIMTYATNNNVTKKDKKTITLTIVRTHVVPEGIAIESWL